MGGESGEWVELVWLEGGDFSKAMSAVAAGAAKLSSSHPPPQSSGGGDEWAELYNPAAAAPTSL